MQIPSRTVPKFNLRIVEDKSIPLKHISGVLEPGIRGQLLIRVQIEEKAESASMEAK
jgi:hypothetical protein